MGNVLFDLKKYTLPSPKELDMHATKKNIESFFKQYEHYKALNQFQYTEPKITSMMAFAPPTPKSGAHSTTGGRYMQLSYSLKAGLDSISCPLSVERKMRRKHIFVLKFIEGIDRLEIMSRLAVEKDTYNKELNWACAHFAFALGIHKMKKRIKSE